ncbi:MAG TPA: hypothetical protein VGD47_03260 [Steroidobacteraceae bacterium]
MSEPEWRLLTTLPDLPSAQSLAEVLAADGVAVRVMSDAGVLGQAAPSRIYVEASQFSRAQEFIAPCVITDEELSCLAGADPPADEGR